MNKCRTCKHAFTTGKNRWYCKKPLADKDDCGEYEMMNDKIKNAFKSTKIDPLDDSMDFTYEIKRQVREDADNFIFETIEPYCSNIAQQKISKKDLNEAIQLWMAAKRIMHVEEDNDLGRKEETND